MNIEEFRLFCLQKPHVTECMPFGDDILVFKVAHKMFALTKLNSSEFTVNLKCDPEQALFLREKYSAVKPGYHMSKTHWNTVDFKSDLSDSFLKSLINDSYALVIQGLSKKLRENLNF